MNREQDITRDPEVSPDIPQARKAPEGQLSFDRIDLASPIPVTSGEPAPVADETAHAPLSREALLAAIESGSNPIITFIGHDRENGTKVLSLAFSEFTSKEILKGALRGDHNMTIAANVEGKLYQTTVDEFQSFRNE
ncbi:MAG: hypothetical protein WC107_00745 [Patescibacteria group bacterium]